MLLKGKLLVLSGFGLTAIGGVAVASSFYSIKSKNFVLKNAVEKPDYFIDLVVDSSNVLEIYESKNFTNHLFF